MSDYHAGNLNHHQSAFLTTQMFPGFVEPPPPYGAATAPILNPSHPSPSAAHSSSAFASVEHHQHRQAQHFGADKFHSSDSQQTHTTGASSNSNDRSSGGQQQMPYFQPQMAPAQQTMPAASVETPVLPPGAVPFSTNSPPTVHSVYTSQNIPMGGHSFPVGGSNVSSHQIVKMIFAIPLGPHEMQLECSNCRQSVRTRVVRRPGLLTWIICGALALVGCWPCCVLPFCAQSCQDVEHFCANCNAFVGKYSRI
ncbi:hypothetical protein niasHT_039844 [Heterodera trifolii]|uniref:LITAF domain-containing protein n=1 Tax=Heterodera trifolii TaxID=157864 RepID=A0ABD2IMR8_9BILA